MYPDLKGKRIVITGASRGIGKALALAFLEEGCHVVAIARGPIEWAAQTVDNRLEVLQCDIRYPKPLTQWLAVLSGRGQTVDVLVNNAGSLLKKKLIDCNEDDFDDAFAVNTRAMFGLSQVFAAHMKNHGGGVIINAASFAASQASISHGLYAASKAATVALTRSMAAEWAPFGIRVNAFSPGVIPTEMTESALRDNADKMLQTVSLRRFGTTSEVAAVALFLASSTSSYLTGVNIDVSGGKLIVQDPGAAWG